MGAGKQFRRLLPRADMPRLGSEVESDMPWLLGMAVVLCGIGLAVFAVRANAQAGPGGVTAEMVSKASNAEIERMLRTVETGPVPELKLGAMCYAPLPPMTRYEYVCPVCGEKTLYAADAEQSWIPATGIDAMRRARDGAAAAATQAGAAVVLDEKQYCRKCLPELARAPQAAVEVTLPDGHVQRTEAIQLQDLWILRDFFSGKNVLVGGNESESPLKGSLPRLRELLGLEKAEE